jgi:hypothetical protein
MLDASFPTLFESFQKKVGDQFFPERSDRFRNPFCEESNIHYHVRFETFMVVLVFLISRSLVRGYKRAVWGRRHVPVKSLCASTTTHKMNNVSCRYQGVSSQYIYSDTVLLRGTEL